MLKDGIPGHVLILRASVVGLLAAAAAAAMRFFSEKRRPPAAEEQWSAPRLVLTDSGRVDELESFPQYVGRQLGFDDMSECPQLGKLAHDYLKKAAGCEDNIFAFFANEPSPENLYAQLVEELDRCILGYFAFHWTHATLLIRQVLTVESEQKKKLKNIVMEATRKMRFERVTRDLKVTRVFSTLVEEMKAIGMGPNGDADARCTDKMVPAAPSERSPVLLLMGGGMGAGKSTVLKDILRDSTWGHQVARARSSVVAELWRRHWSSPCEGIWQLVATELIALGRPRGGASTRHRETVNSIIGRSWAAPSQRPRRDLSDLIAIPKPSAQSPRSHQQPEDIGVISAI